MIKNHENSYKIVILIIITIIIVLILSLLYFSSKKLQKEIYNNSDTIKYLIGPVTGSFQFSGKYNKKIYIFGDVHLPKLRCLPDQNEDNSMRIADYLISLAGLVDEKGLPLKLDYFFETTFREKYEVSFLDTMIKRNLPIDEVVIKFLNCLEIIKDICEYKNVRFHNSDVRLGNKELNELVIFGLMLTKKPDETKKYSWEPIKKILADPSKIFRDTKIDKQIMNIPQTLPVVREVALKVREKIGFQFFELFQAIPVIEKMIKEDMVNSTIETINVFRRFIYLLQDTPAEMMDLYIFSRIFREFQPKEGQFSESPQNIIIYVGDHHAERLRVLLNIIGFNMISFSKSETENEDYQCLNISNFKQPFFL